MKEYRPIVMDEDVKRLADCIHDTHCHWNHTDGCDWFYHSWTVYEQSGGVIGYSRGEFAAKAQAVIDVLVESGTDRNDIDFDLLIAVINAAGKS
jgi:hypothetical protein